MYTSKPPRALAGAASLAIVGAVVAALVLGLRVQLTSRAPASLVAIDLPKPKPPPSPPPEPPRRKAESSAAEGNPSPPNLRDRATQVVAPRVPPLVIPPPVVAATEAGTGSAQRTGAADVPGPGRGAGGFGDGDGGGGDGGNGDGDGDAVVGPRRLSGRLAYGDLPEGVLRPGEEAAVQVRYTVNPDGRASRCRAVRTSGYSLLDTLACQLVVQRFRFRPARNAAGRAVAADIIETHTWVEDGEAPR